MKVRFLGAHNVEAGSLKLPGVLVDDILALDAGSLGSLSISGQLGLKAILLTHQHYDHLRDLPILGMNLYLNSTSVAVYGLPEAEEILASHLLNGSVYSHFLDNGTFRYCRIVPEKIIQAERYDILPVKVNHSVPAIGYEVCTKGHRLFYSGDTGPGLDCIWERLRPDLIIIEVTSPNRWTDFGRKVGHLTPVLLKEELETFYRLNGYVPPVYTVHANPLAEDVIRTELAKVARQLNCQITVAHEGLEIGI